MSSRTVYQALRDTARKYGDRDALLQPTAGEGTKKYRIWSWNEYLTEAIEIAAGLRFLGLGKGDICALNSETRAEFYLADIGIMTNGSVAAALYTNYPAADLLATIAKSGAKALFVETPKMLAHLRSAPVAHFHFAYRRGGRCHDAWPVARARP